MHSKLNSLVLLVLVTAANAQLHLLARATGKQYFGTATDNPELVDKPYLKQLSNNHDFGQITPSNSMKWFATEPVQGKFNFTGAEEIVKLAKKNKQLVRGHNCVWHSQLADWVESGAFDNVTLTSIMIKHCYTLVKHFKGDILQWDVVNEPFNEDGTFRSTVFYDTIGESYIETALRSARAADPSAKLYINDYNIEGLSPKSTGMLNLVKSLKAKRAPIDGIGIQGHLIVGQLPSFDSIKSNLQAFTNLGVDVAITELDIRMPTPPTTDSLAQQKIDYETVVKACNEVKRCVGVTIWDWTDKYSWVPGVFTGEGAALPWDDDLKKKPAYDGIAAGLRG
ncbi:endo-1,4-beta xylanase [Crepidotus variabilis]|uniref:Beta-xylanase n=1 Tax=Crepidotus variabilis TaxID=179855 RepID=A0A9P6ESL4_9AGAR|nr:endo-1,4-beta xylanase [Crepidotus variabilis]